MKNNKKLIDIYPVTLMANKELGKYLNKGLLKEKKEKAEKIIERSGLPKIPGK